MTARTVHCTYKSSRVPHYQNEFVLLVNYRADPYNLELLKINMNEDSNAKHMAKVSAEANDMYKNVLSFTSDRLNSELSKFFEMEENESFYDTVTLLCHPLGETDTRVKKSAPTLSSMISIFRVILKLKPVDGFCVQEAPFMKILKDPRTKNSAKIYMRLVTGMGNNNKTSRSSYTSCSSMRP